MSGEIQVIIDSAEHPVMRQEFELTNETLGILDISVDTLNYGDYILISEGHKLVFTFKEINDFRQSYFSGHLQDEIINMYLSCPDCIHALVIARDKTIRHKQEVISWVSQHWQKRSFIIPTFKFGSRADAVEFMVECAMNPDHLNYIKRPIRIGKPASETAQWYAAIYGVGEEKAKLLADRYPSISQLVKAIEEGESWSVGIFGKKMTENIENFVMFGKDLTRKKRKNDGE